MDVSMLQVSGMPLFLRITMLGKVLWMEWLGTRKEVITLDFVYIGVCCLHLKLPVWVLDLSFVLRISSELLKTTSRYFH